MDVAWGWFVKATNSVGHVYSSSRWVPVFDNFTITAKVRRPGNSVSSYGIIVRGTTAPFDSVKMWGSGYLFIVNNNNNFSVWKVNPGAIDTSLVPWSETDAMDGTTWNTLKITANLSSLKFYINDYLVANVKDYAYSSGAVGLIAYNLNSSGFFTDFVTLTMPDPPFYTPATTATGRLVDCPPDSRGCLIDQ
jgi:hypothetical protein